LGLCACGGGSGSGSGSNDKVNITLYAGSPDTVELGQSTKLFFTVDPADAALSIDGVGDVSGKTEVTVTPGATTVYKLTATKGKASAQRDVTITVRSARSAGFTVVPASGTPTAGQSVTVAVTAVDATGATLTTFRGTV